MHLWRYKIVIVIIIIIIIIIIRCLQFDFIKNYEVFNDPHGAILLELLLLLLLILLSQIIIV